MENEKEMGVEVGKSKDEPQRIIEVREMSQDEHHLASLGYKQVFIRSFGMFENWAATFVCCHAVFFDKHTPHHSPLADHNELRQWDASLIWLCYVHRGATGGVCKLDNGRRLLFHRVLGYGRDCCILTNSWRYLLLGVQTGWTQVWAAAELAHRCCTRENPALRDVLTIPQLGTTGQAGLQLYQVSIKGHLAQC